MNKIKFETFDDWYKSKEHRVSQVVRCGEIWHICYYKDNPVMKKRAALRFYNILRKGIYD